MSHGLLVIYEVTSTMALMCGISMNAEALEDDLFEESGFMRVIKKS